MRLRTAINLALLIFSGFARPIPNTVTCSLCFKTVPAEETCSTLACRACHVTLTLEECRAGVIR